MRRLAERPTSSKEERCTERCKATRAAIKRTSQSTACTTHPFGKPWRV